MVSLRKRLSNRANAQHSTGPRSPQGKAVVSRNALRHGLAASVFDLEPVRIEVEQLANAIFESFNKQGDREVATRIAEAQIDLNRVRQARRSTLNRACLALGVKVDPSLHVGDDRNASSLQLMRNNQRGKYETHELYDGTTVDSEDALEAEKLIELVKKLSALDRYETRALSKRKFAIRKFTALLRSEAVP